MKLKLFLIVPLLLSGCAAPLVTEPVAIESTLIHGVDSDITVDSPLFDLASVCIGATPKFWARYFNQSDIPERISNGMKYANRFDISFNINKDLFIASKNLRLIPIFAQNINHLDYSAGERHGKTNAKDLLKYAGEQRVIKQTKTGTLYIFLNQEENDKPLTVDYWRGWTTGFASEIKNAGGNDSSIRPGLYARPQNQKQIVPVINAIRADKTLKYAGLWLVSIDNKKLNPGHPAKTCGKLMNWETSFPPSLPDVGPILMRQYVLDVTDKNKRTLDLNALNPKYADEILRGLLIF